MLKVQMWAKGVCCLHMLKVKMLAYVDMWAKGVFDLSVLGVHSG